MATHEELVDLSLFATSPSIDWHFEPLDPPPHNHSEYYAPSDSEYHSQSCGFQPQRHTGSNLPTDFDLSLQNSAAFDFGFSSQSNTATGRSFYDPPDDPVIRPLPRSYSLKPLPPLPPKKLCKPKLSRKRTDAQSRCILNRLRKSKSEDPTSGRRDALQQRRHLNSTPQLTLTVPRSARGSTNPAPEMVWLPEEQMWLVTDRRSEDVHQSPPQYSSPAFDRRQPSPSVYSDPTPPLTPDMSQPRNPLIDDDGLSPIQSQFRSLIVNEERRSPLFQEAMQTIEDFDPMRSSQQYQATDDDDDDGWPVDDDGWPIYDPRMYESPIEAVSEGEVEELVSPESPHTPESPFDEIEREWNSAVSVYSASGSTESRQHSRDTSDQSYHSAVSTMTFAKHEDPVDFYLQQKPLWHGLARSISSQTSRG